MKCWEFMKCGCEAGGENADKLGICPAYPHNGNTCASVLGTLCGGKEQSSMILKLSECFVCSFYHSHHHYKEYTA